MVDGSNESLYYPDEELDPNLRKGIPLQKSFEKVDVLSIPQDRFKAKFMQAFIKRGYIFVAMIVCTLQAPQS